MKIRSCKEAFVLLRRLTWEGYPFIQKTKKFEGRAVEPFRVVEATFTNTDPASYIFKWISLPIGGTDEIKCTFWKHS